MKRSARQNRHPSRRGLSLVEVTASTVLVAFLLVASLRTTANTFLTWSVAADQGRAMQLCELLMTEILAKNYWDPEETPDKYMGVDGGEIANDRTTFDDIDDYLNYSSTPPKDAANQPIAGFDGWTMTVIVKKIEKSDPAIEKLDTDSDKGVKKIKLMVTDPGGKTTTLEAIRGLSGQMEQPTGVDTDFNTWVGCQLTIDSTTVESGVGIINHADDP